MLYFTTYFDKNYLSRGLVLYESLRKHCIDFELYILCLDEFTHEYFKKSNDSFPSVKTLSINELEDYDTDLKECKKTRNKIEYYFTLSPCLPLYLLKKYQLPHICSLDADIMFFSSPEKIFSYLEMYSVLITPHNYSTGLKHKEIYGNYNVSFQIFKNDENGLECLEGWRKQCIDWCYDKLEDNKYADQKYLDNWTSEYKGVYPIDILGSGVAPWNLNRHKIKSINGSLYLNNSKLIFYHFHDLRIIDEQLILHGLDNYLVKMDNTIINSLYKPYIDNIFSYNFSSDTEIKRYNTQQQNTLKTILFRKNWFYYRSGLLFEKSNIFRSLGRIFLKMLNKK